mgnify:FL=1|jgi:2-keto-4-pentenoate hydratase/2-oxohepta-3-ene-1,7-dioic acid hydratase in catechol pathway
MRLVTFKRNSKISLGALTDDLQKVVGLQQVYQRAQNSTHAALESMQALIESGSEGLAVAASALAAATADEQQPLGSVSLLAPLPVPPQIRDCLCFEDHVVNAMQMASKQTGEPPAQRHVDMLETMRKQPIWYKANRFAVVGPDHEVRWPSSSSLMDYELEMGMVLGRTGVNISREEAASYIFGYTIFNDLSARDIQMEEMVGGLGPTKGKDFDGANVFGPCIVTADEFDPNDAKMSVRVNGELRSEGNSSGMKYRFEDLIAYISRDETLHAGEILCSGTVGGGCGLELGQLLQSGDVVELEIEGIGVLRNRIVAADHK